MLEIHVDIRKAEQYLRGMHRDQIPFALSQALNKTALKVQSEVREDIQESFTLRRRDWAMRTVKIGRGDFAKKNRLRAIVRMESPGGGKRTDILAKFEKAHTKRPRGGSRLAIPVEVRTTKVGVTRKGQRPKSFEFVHHGGNVWIGKKRTFMIRNPDGTGGIYQRTGPRNKRGKRDTRDRRFRDKVVQRKDSSLRQLYRFTPTAGIDKRLHFEDTARKVVITTFHKEFAEAFKNAIRTAR